MMKLKTKKIPYYLLVILFALGASLILGLLSFGGMYVLLPVLSIAILSFVLSTAYEGEIYLQNIKGAFDKLVFKTNYLEQSLSNATLLSLFETHLKEDVLPDNCPEFLKDYHLQHQKLIELNKKNLNAHEKQEKKRIKTSLSAMDAWFAKQLFRPETTKTPYEKELHDWLNNNIDVQSLQTQLASKKRYAQAGMAFSAITAVFMTLGTLYLLAGVPFLAAAPLIILVPMAMLAGIAYGLLIFNTIGNMLQNDTFQTWYNTLKADFKENKLTFTNGLFLTTATVLVALAVVLTVCTAGTWWTIAKHTPRAIHVLRKLPSVIMSVINPLFTGIAALLFSLENTSETLETIYEFFNNISTYVNAFKDKTTKAFDDLLEREHPLQLLNPFRIILKLTLLPLEIVFFFGHLLSIAVSADQMPGLPKTFSTLSNWVTEFFEDWHYFFHGGHSHHYHDEAIELMRHRLGKKESHHHHTDIPSLILRSLFSPIFALAAVWDWAASQRNDDPLRFSEAVERQTGIDEKTFIAIVDMLSYPFKAKEPITQPEAPQAFIADEEIAPEPAKPSVSKSWTAAHAELLIERHINKHLSAPLMWNHGQAMDKQRELKSFQSSIRENGLDASTLQEQQEKVVYAKQRFSLFAQEHDATRTVQFLDKLSKTVGMA